MVTVIIPAYNCAKYIEEAVRSVLTQTCHDFKVLIIEDASTDETLLLSRQIAAEDHRVFVMTNEYNLGVARTRNKGIETVQSEYVAFLDADDRWLPEKLERQINFMNTQKLDLCYTAYRFIGEKGQIIRAPYYVSEQLTWKTLLRENIIGLSSVLMRTDIIRNIRMRPEFAHEDYVFWLELMQNGCQAGGINTPLMQYRVSASNRSGDKKKAAYNRWIIYRNFLNMGRIQALWWFAQYGLNGIRKHFF